ncbi:hypothetical protein [Ktedonospora formicarum]|uniref:Uncharacterized protein n=1 Tax=Ktedonospora formicarum TaxID=2778364 RepID=A0A8J3ICR8_9CHLR|nr:hypothetical protein [Ktedonospora formicarum]GHO49729.1 hypothetical protein KSX_78920 [Ktedonospora formicarum]
MDKPYLRSHSCFTQGSFVYVGDSGDIIDIATCTIIGNLPSLSNTRVFQEIDWSNGQPTFTTSLHGLVYVL